MTSSSSAISSVPALPQYPLVCAMQGLEREHYRIALKTLMYILNGKAVDRDKKEYVFEEDTVSHRLYVYARNKFGEGNGKKTALLGYDKNFSVWYTAQKDSGKIHAFLKNLTILDPTQVKQIPGQDRALVERSQSVIVEELLKVLKLAPPFFAMQAIYPEQFASMPRAAASAKNIEGISVDSLPQFLTELLKVNRGLFFGHDHSNLKNGMTDLVVDQMQTLFDAGVRHIYDEIPAYVAFANFEKFNLDQNDDGTDLENLFKGDGDQYCSERMRIYREAKKRGIQVWPIDNNDRSPDVKRRMALGDGVMVCNIDRFSSQLKEGEKFIDLSGAAHYGVAEKLGIPNIRIQSTYNRCLGQKSAQAKQIDAMNDKMWEGLSREEQRKILEGAPDFFITHEPDYARKYAEVIQNDSVK